MLARKRREHSDQARLMEAVTKHIVANTVESSMGTKKGSGQKAADNVRFLADKRAEKELTVSQGTALFGGQPLVPEGMTAAEVIAGG